MKSGFSLIELVVAISISSILSLMLYRALTDVTAINKRINSIVDIDTQIAVFYNQLDKDLSSAFYPEQAGLQIIPSEQEAKKEIPKVEAKTTTTTEEFKPTKIEDAFFAENEESNLYILSMINTNPLHAFDEIVPFIVQVAYRLLPNKENPGTFTLYRQQTAKLGPDVLEDEKMTKIRGYEIITGLKSLRAQFIFAKPKENETDKEKAETIRLKEWDIEENLEKYKKPLPDFVEIEGEIEDEAKKRSKTFKFIIPVFAKYQDPKKETPKLPSQPPTSFKTTGTKK